MRLQDLNWMDVENYLKDDDRIILVTGATEQHAYLSLMTDILIPYKIALAVAERERVLVAPALNFGISTEFTPYPGTISLSKTTFEAVLYEVAQSLLSQGFTRFFIFNGHGGNDIPTQLQDMQLDGLARIEWYDWWQGETARAFEDEYGLRMEHANWSENFAFTRVAEVPAEDKPLVNLGYLEAGEPIRDVLGDGSYGGPYQIDEALMDELFNRLVEEACALVRGLSSP